MSAQFFFNTILIIITAEFFLERILDFLNLSKLSVNIPGTIKNIYNENEYVKSQEYLRHNNRVAVVSSTLSFCILFVSIYFNLFAYLDAFIRQTTSNAILISLCFFGVLMFISNIISLPFSYYSIFVTEENFGFNTSNRKTFFMDLLKENVLAVLIGGSLFSLIMWIYTYFTSDFWWVACLLVSVFSIFMNMFYSSLIVPLFNKQTPLEDGDLKNSISEFASKVDFKIDNIYVIDGSKRSSKANAYFSGLGSKKRIVLYDTLIEKLSKEQIVAVLAHEVGHYKKKHSLISLFFSILQTAFMFYILSLCLSVDNISYALGVDIPSFHIGLLSFSLLYGPISTLISLFMNILSRKNEYQADAFAVDNYSSQHLSDGLKILSISSLSNLLPHKAYEFVYYSHPSLLRRLKAINGNKK